MQVHIAERLLTPFSEPARLQASQFNSLQSAPSATDAMRASHMLITPASNKTYGARPAIAPAPRPAHRGADMRSRCHQSRAKLVARSRQTAQDRTAGRSQGPGTGTGEKRDAAPSSSTAEITLRPHQPPPDAHPTAGKHQEQCSMRSAASSTSGSEDSEPVSLQQRTSATAHDSVQAGNIEADHKPLHNPQRQQDVNKLEQALAALERDVQQSARHCTGNKQAEGDSGRLNEQRQSADARSFSASLDSLAALEAEIAVQHQRLQDAGMQLPADGPSAALWSPSGSTLTTSDTQRGAAPAPAQRQADASCKRAHNAAAPCVPHDGPCTTKTHAGPSGAPRCRTFAYSPDSVINDVGQGHTVLAAEAAVSIKDRLQQLGLSVRSHGLICLQQA